MDIYLYLNAFCCFNGPFVGFIQCTLREIYWIISNTYLFHDLEVCSHGFGEAREQAELWDQAYNLVNSLLGLRLLLWSVKITTFKIVVLNGVYSYKKELKLVPDRGSHVSEIT